MKKLFSSLFLFLIGTSLFLSAQTNSSTTGFIIQGEIIDSLNNETVPYATIKIFSTEQVQKPVKVMVTDENGKFRETISQSGDYLLEVEFIGKKRVQIPFSAGDKPVIDFGRITMIDDTQLLGEVVVSAQKPLVQVDLDKITYSMEDDPEAKTNNVLEMLKKVPMVTVDGEENVQLKGSSNFKYYMNGKPSTLIGNNPKDVLKSMPANIIKNIEVITDPGAKYDAEGVTGIINIITQEQSSLGGYTVSLNGGANNRGGFNGGTYFSLKYGKIGLTGNLNYFNQQSPKGESSSFREDFTNNVNHYLTQDGWSKSHGHGMYGYGELSYEIDTLNLINISFNRYGGDFKSDVEQSVRMDDRVHDPVYEYTRTGNSTMGWGNTTVGVDYQRTFSLKDRLLTASYRLNSSPNDMNSDNVITGILNFDDNHNRQISNGSTDEHTFQLDYTTPINKIHTVETGVKYIKRINESNSGISYLVGNNWVSTPSYQDKFQHVQDIVAAYGGYSLKYKKWGFKAGIRFEGTWLNAEFPVDKTKNFDANYANFVPSTTITYQIRPGQTIRGGYTMRISRPDIWYLNPYHNTTDTSYVQFGNPDLEAVKYHTFSLNYNFFNPKFNANVNLSYNQTNNSIDELTWIKNGVSYTTYDNIANGKRTNLSVYLNWSPTPKLRIYSNLSGNYVDIKSNREANVSTNGFTESIYGGAQYSIPKDIAFNLGGYYSSPNINLQSEGTSFFFYNFSVSKSFLKKNLNIRAYITNPFHDKVNFRSKRETDDFYYESNNYQYRRQFGLSVSYRFGEMKTQIKKAQRGIQNDDAMGGGNQSQGSGDSGGGQP